MYMSSLGHVDQTRLSSCESDYVLHRTWRLTAEARCSDVNGPFESLRQ